MDACQAPLPPEAEPGGNEEGAVTADAVTQDGDGPDVGERQQAAAAGLVAKA